jgi:hypothetical protein
MTVPGANRARSWWVRAWVVTPIAASIIFAAAAVVGTSQRPPDYEATAIVIYVGGVDNPADESEQAAFAAVLSDEVLEEVSEAVDVPVVSLQRTVTAEQTMAGDVTLVVRSSASRAETAAQIANAVANAAADLSTQRTVAALESQAAEVQPGVEAARAQLEALGPDDSARPAVMSQFVALQTEQSQLEAAAATTAGTLVVSRHATPPRRPVGLHGAQAALAGAALGLVLGATGVLALWSRRRPPYVDGASA